MYRINWPPGHRPWKIFVDEDDLLPAAEVEAILKKNNICVFHD